MKEQFDEYFSFLLKKEPIPKNIQSIKSFSSIKNKLILLMKSKENITFFIPGLASGFQSKFLKIVKKDDQFLVAVDVPSPKSALVHISKKRIAVAVFELNGLRYALYLKAWTILKKSHVTIFYFPKSIYRLQRRQFFRLEINDEHPILVTYTIESENYVLLAKDISIGGISFYSPLELETLYESLLEKDDSKIEFDESIIQAEEEEFEKLIQNSTEVEIMMDVQNKISDILSFEDIDEKEINKQDNKDNVDEDEDTSYQNLDIIITMPDDRSIPATVEIKHILDTKGNRKMNSRLCMEFVFMLEEDAEYLKEYIFEEEKKIARNMAH